MNCIVLDDEDLSIKHLVDNNIKKIPYLNLVATFTNPEEALLFLHTNPVDLIFLDIEMPNHRIDGIDFMKIMKPNQQYILTTAHPEYALESYDYHVIDYLRKPFSFERFAKAVLKAQPLIKDQIVEASAKTDESMFVKSAGKLQRLFFEQICYIEAERNYATIFRPADSFSTKTTLNKLGEELPTNQFFRVHKSYIVSLDKVEFVKKDQIGITRNQGFELVPVSSQFKKSFLQTIESRRRLNLKG
ncbi:LytR/AlgR family response regulator transcription factor [Spirosoma flavum]|uniref:LytR/AlgR family response regulator transcription factor n=1 Tax=Spirosoma flavum TaxID=2048557 RepID=A0ABW6APH1_9BACT